MFKKIVYPFMCVLLLVVGILCIQYEKDAPALQKIMPVQAIDLNLNCGASYLIEEKTGKVLYAQNETERLKPASMTKMMGLLLICEQIDQKKISLDDIVTISASAAAMGGSQVFLEVNEQMSVHDLLKSVCISSANDAMYALGEFVATTNDRFVELMNQKAKELNLENTHFVNVTGFDDDNHYTCAKDMAIIAQNLLQYPDLILPYTSMYDGYIRENSEQPFWLVNTNKLIRFYEGMDGLKTGYTSQSGFCLTATAKRNNVRLISVIMKADTSANRNEMTKTLLDYGFSKLEAKTLYQANDKVATIEIKKAKQPKVDVYTPQDIQVILDKEKENENIKQQIQLKDSLKAPLKKDSVIGQLVVTVDEDVYTFDLIIKEDIDLLTYKEIFGDFLKSILA